MFRCPRTTLLIVLAAVLLLLVEEGSATNAETAEAAMPRESEAYRDARRLLPDRFVEHETTRYIVLSDATVGWSKQQAELLERTHHQFVRFCRRLSLEPEPLRHKLVAIVFQSRAEYRRFAREHDDVADPSLSGYYSPRYDRVVFYDIESSPSVTEARQRLAEMESEIAELSDQLTRTVDRRHPDAMSTLRNIQNQYRQHWWEQRQRVDEYAAQTSVATTIHEATHQLMFHTAIQSPHVHYPLWISEGLATAFETDEPRAAFGPGHDFDARREDFRSLVRDDRLLPLRELLSITRLEEASGGQSTLVYHQSFALVDWLSRRRPAQLRTYLRAMTEREGERLTAQQHLDAFERVFGPLATVERAWLRDERAETRGELSGFRAQGSE